MRGEAGLVAARVRALLGEQVAVRQSERLGPAAGSGAVDGRAVAQEVDEEREVRVRPAASAGRRLRALSRSWPVRLDPGRRAAVAVGVGVLLAAAATGAWVVTDRPQPVAVAVHTAATNSSAASSGRTVAGPAVASNMSSATAGSGTTDVSGSAAVVVVDVAGKVHRPGLYRLAAGSRIDDAVRAAGGALHGTNLTSLNLASKVIDGQQIVVGLSGSSAPGPVVGGVPAGTSSAGAGAVSSSAPIDLNTAGADQLQALPGVGPVLAQHILDWRSAHGSFGSVSQLNDVPGIGEVKFAELRSLVSV